MDDFKQSISQPRKGMSKSVDPRNLQNNDYTHAKNANISSVDGDNIDLTFEKSNVLAVDFPSGYRVIGKVNRLLKNFTYYFLSNPVSKTSIIGYVDNNELFEDISDSKNNTGSELQTPLEEVNQIPYKKFNILIDDSCIGNQKERLNFHIDYPIKNPVIKEQKVGGGIIYFTDNYNPPRFVEVDNIKKYFTKEQPCEDDIELTCPDIYKMRLHSDYRLPEIEETSIAIGGSLNKGSYNFLIALTDAMGNEISEYSSLMQPTDLFEITSDNFTNKAIKIKVGTIDSKYTHYKIIVIYTNKEHRETTYYDAGVFSANNREVIITDLSTYQRTSIEKLSFVNQKVDKAEGMTTINNSLAEYGLTYERELNLQPVVNLMGSFLEWQTHVAKEDLYTFGDKRSKYLGINRNEIVPYGIRFLRKGGTPTAIFPLVGREANPSDLQAVPETDINRISYEKTGDCTDSLRERRWQYYNTATVTNKYQNTGGTVVVETDVFKTCNNTNVYTVSKGSFVLPEEAYVGDAKQYIIDNSSDCSGGMQGSSICVALNNEYPDASCSVKFDFNCGTPEKVSSVNYVSDVLNATLEYTYILSGYTAKPNTMTVFNPYQRQGIEYIPNTTAPNVTLYERYSNPNGNSTKLMSQMTQNNNQNYYENFKIIECSNKSSIITNGAQSNSNFEGGLFSQDVLDNSQWFKTQLNVGKHISITKTIVNSSGEALPNDSMTFSNKNRVSFFNPLTNSAIHSIIINTDTDSSILIYKTNNILNIRFGSNTIQIPNYSFNEIVFVVEQPYTTLDSTYCLKHATKGLYQVHEEEMQYTDRKIAYDSVIIGSEITYKSICQTTEMTIGSCEVIPYEKGQFGYHESTINYPDNPELYDSSKLIVKTSTVPTDLRNEFSKKFYQSNQGAENKVKDSFNLTCRPIRHFRFPDNNVSPFMSDSMIAPFGDSYIYPLGVTINERAINTLLDVAVDNELMTKDERDSIYGYEMYRGNLATNRSVVSSGLLYDLREYDEKGQKVYYPNYPYNSYGNDVMNQTNNSPNFGRKGDKFTFHSPETDYTFSPLQASELNIQGYQFGYSKGYFDEVNDHPKWVILSPKAYDTASTLATIEVASEATIAMMTAQANVDTLWFVGGMGSTGTNTGGYIAQMAIATLIGVAMGLEAVIYNYGRYKNQWLETFQNMGRGHNFASYYFSTGDYNYLQTLQQSDNSIRGLEVVKTVKDGRLNLTNRVTKEKYDVNNTDREWSTMIVINKDTPINYPNQYSTYDTDSITYQSKEGLSTSGKSDEIRKKIASPYVQLVNYNPSLHGDIKSISWITTSYKGDLENPYTDFLPIFGGDTYISRHTLKRKLPLFLTTAMGQGTSVAFEYSRYNNIGRNPKFFLDYNIDSEYSQSRQIFPEIRSRYSLDNQDSKRFYLVSPSKFYLYYYGIPNFLVETRINTNNREYGSRVAEDFYPNVGDIGRWTQEKTVSIREPNFFKYSSVYSNQAFPFNYRTLPNEFSTNVQGIIDKSVNGVMFSLPDNDENGQTDPWLKFLPLDFYEFESKYGKLRELKGIENEAVLARFDNTSILYNKVSSTIDDGQSPTTFLGGRSIFQRRTVSFVNSELGFGGTQHGESLSCEFGHFYVDNKRGQVIQIPPQGGNMTDISDFNQGGNPTNMKEWFKRHLPYKLLKSKIKGIENLNVDNSYNKIGMTFAYDSIHKRVLITKKDYIPVTDCEITYDKDSGFFTDNCQPPVLTCPEGYTFNESTNLREKITETSVCPEGYTYNPNTGMCETQSPQPIEYDGADIVFVTGYGGVDGSIPFTNTIRDRLIDFLKDSNFENRFGSNIRYGLVRVNNSKERGNRKYNIYNPFTTDKQAILRTLEGSEYQLTPAESNYSLEGNWIAPITYSPADLALRAVIENKKEITWQLEEIQESQSVGEFRQGNIAKIIYYLGHYSTGTGMSIHEDGIGHNASPVASDENWKGEYILQQTLKPIAMQKDIDIYSAYTVTTAPPLKYPSSENNWRGSAEWFPFSMATTECWHYRRVYAGATQYYFMLDSLDTVGYRTCETSIPPKCQCSIVNSMCVCKETTTPSLEKPKIPIELDDERYFKNVSWTVSYHPTYGLFGSFFDYKPSYYVNHHEMFEAGYNGNESKLWSHGVTNKSFGVFQGLKYGMEVESVAGANLNTYIGSIGLLTEAKRYFDNEDFYLNHDLTFNQSVLYNRKECSGLLTLDLVKGGVRYLSKYPITIDDKNQRIPLTKTEQLFNYNYFYNRVNKDFNKPFIVHDENEIDIKVDNVSFNKKGQVERLNGSYFLNRLYYNKDSRFSLTIKLQKSLTNLDNL